jgi:hypothetical protein
MAMKAVKITLIAALFLIVIIVVLRFSLVNNSLTLLTPRFRHQTFLLKNGNVLLISGSSSGSTTIEELDLLHQKSYLKRVRLTDRANTNAILLSNGNILISGGDQFNAVINSQPQYPDAVVYDPYQDQLVRRVQVGNFRASEAVTLKDGRTFIFRGWRGNVYDPEEHTLYETENAHIGRVGCSVTLLPDGKVLIAGGVIPDGSRKLTDTVEIFDPETTEYTLIDSRLSVGLGVGLDGSESYHQTVRLKNGKVLFIGADGHTEVFDPNTKQFHRTGSLNLARSGYTTTLLKDGSVLITGGGNQVSLWGIPWINTDLIELFNPKSERVKTIGFLNKNRMRHSSLLLRDGSVLTSGGDGPTHFPWPWTDGVYNDAEIIKPQNNLFYYIP